MFRYSIKLNVTEFDIGRVVIEGLRYLRGAGNRRG